MSALRPSLILCDPGADVSNCGYTYYWSGRRQRHLQRVDVTAANRLVPVVTEVTPVNKRVVGLRSLHILHGISLVAIYAPTGANEFFVQEAFYAQLPTAVVHEGYFDRPG